MNAERDGHEIAGILLPHPAEKPGSRGQQFVQQGVSAAGVKNDAVSHCPQLFDIIVNDQLDESGNHGGIGPVMRHRLPGAAGLSSGLQQARQNVLGDHISQQITPGAGIGTSRISRDFRRLIEKLGKVDGTILAASLMLVMDEVPDSVASKKVAAEYIAAYTKMYGTAPATFGANVYDAGLLLAAAVPTALKAGKPGTEAFRTALRDEIEKTKELVGAQGVYTMTPADHSGFDDRGRVLITVKDGSWHLIQ